MAGNQLFQLFTVVLLTCAHDLHSAHDQPRRACLSSSWKQKYFVKNKDNTYTIAPVIKQNVIFQTFNLMNPIRFRRPFDLIFCRNVMIYFDQATKDALVQRFYDATVPGGYLLIGHSEGLNKAACPYEYLMPAIYQKTRR